MKELMATFTPHEGGWLMKVVKQTHRYLEFGARDYTFTASNGMRLISLFSPVAMFDRVSNKLWVRGYSAMRDNDSIFIPSEKLLTDIKGAVAEYNRVFSDIPKQVEPPPIPQVVAPQPFVQPESVIDPPLEGATKTILVDFSTNYEFKFPGYSVVVSPLGVIVQK